MKYRVFFTAEAATQIDQIADWWAEHRSVEQAARWYVGISEAIESLASNPDRCPRAREDDGFPFELRELHYGLGSRPTHRVIFTIRPDMVLIISIRHAAQDDLTPDDI